uniref:Uncharacterized protein n=1 Tax=mine drainage metagenome TaxID=410659 RepID=E6QLM1_9ZZZZ
MLRVVSGIFFQPGRGIWGYFC